MRRLLFAVTLYSLILFGSESRGADASSSTNAGPASAAVSEAVLKLSLERITAEIKRLSVETNQISDFMVVIQQARARSTNTTALDQSLQFVAGQVSNLVETAKTNASVDFTNSINLVRGYAYSLLTAVQPFGANQLYELRNRLGVSGYYGRDPEVKLPESTRTMLVQKLDRVTDESYRTDVVRTNFPNLYIFTTYGRVDAVPPSLSTLIALQTELAPQNLSLFRQAEVSARDLEKKVFTELEETLSGELTRRVEQMKNLQTEFNNVDEQLKKKEERLQQRSDQIVSSNLLYIFIGFLVTILATLIILRSRGDEISLLMIRERTAVELLSIGMFLATVLFLGAGAFLERATLGTLLGTLAGYLFTRRPSQPSPSIVDDTSELTPERPAKPSWNVTTKVLSLSTLPKNTRVVSAFARSKAGGEVLLLGMSGSAEIKCDTTKAVPNSTYEVWIVPTNGDKTGPPSPMIEVQF
jgi:hypothetical protein